MSIGLFILYYLICTIVLLLISLFIIRFIFKKKFNIFSRVADKAIEDYFNAYDLNDNEFSDSLVDSINIPDSNISNNPINLQQSNTSDESINLQRF